MGDMTQALLQRVLEHVAARVRYEADQPGADYWQTPAESFRRGAGDCEDFAIACWSTAMQWASSPELRDEAGTLRLGWLLSDDAETSHMVCVALPPDEDDPWVLDMLADTVHRLSQRDDGLRLLVTLGLDADNRPAAWHGFGRQAASSQPAKWVDVLQRMGVCPGVSHA